MMSVEAAARDELARQIAAGNAELRQLQAAKRDAERQQELQVRHPQRSSLKQHLIMLRIIYDSACMHAIRIPHCTAGVEPDQVSLVGLGVL
jgi:hypothetical protein